MNFQWDLTRLFFGEALHQWVKKKIRLLLTFPSSLFLIFRNTEQFFPSLRTASLRRTWRVALVLSCCGCAAVLPHFGDFLAVFGAVANSVCSIYIYTYHIISHHITSHHIISHTHTYIYICVCIHHILWFMIAGYDLEPRGVRIMFYARENAAKSSGWTRIVRVHPRGFKEIWH